MIIKICLAFIGICAGALIVSSVKTSIAMRNLTREMERIAKAEPMEEDEDAAD